jgi:hypothetical protein
MNYLNQPTLVPNPSGHRRNNSQQMGKSAYELAFGMNKNLQDHMLGTNRKQGSSINSFTSENKDMAGFALP